MLNGCTDDTLGGVRRVAAEFTDRTGGERRLQQHLVASLSETMPLAVTMREDIARLREWARTRTRPASKPEPERPGQIGIV